MLHHPVALASLSVAILGPGTFGIRMIRWPLSRVLGSGRVRVPSTLDSSNIQSQPGA